MISNPRCEVGRKVESSSQLIIRAIFIFLTPPSTVNSQQSTVNNADGATGIDMISQSRVGGVRLCSLRSKAISIADYERGVFNN